MIIGSKIYYFDTIESTNEYAISLIGEVPEGTVVLADQQTGGKGRFGRKWHSPEGGLWFSVILRPPKTSLIAVTAGVAVCKTLHIYDVLTGIKWPNDIMLHDKKVCGILTEIIDDFVVLGIGLNLNIREFPDELKDSASSIFLETKKLLDKKMIYDTLCRKLDNCYSMLQNNMAFELLTLWRQYAVIIGQQVTIEMVDREVTGKALDVNNNGELVIMLVDGSIQIISGGICHLRQKKQHSA